MFGKLKDKLKKSLSVFSRKAREEVVEEPVEEKEEAKEEPVAEEKEDQKTEEFKEEKVEEKAKEQKEDKPKRVKICPECGSLETSIPPAGMDIKMTVQDFCRDCKSRGTFPEIDFSEVEDFRKNLEENKKETEKEAKEPEPAKEEKVAEEAKQETTKPEPKKEEPGPAVEEEPKKKGFFAKAKEYVSTKKISAEKFDDLFWELELALLENNVSVEVIEKIKNDLREELVDKPLPRNVEKKILETLKNSLEEVLDIDKLDFFEKVKEKKPFVIAFFGINGSGKTTTIAKIASMLQEKGMTSVLAAGDTFRAAAIQQLEAHGDKLGLKVIKHDYGSDAAAVAFDAVKYAEKQGLDAVLIDTAGRLHSDSNLMDELSKIVRVVKPDMKVFVGESITGNDCVEQASRFDEHIGIDGIILTKADVDEKGGAAISVSFITKKPILFIGTGQEYSNLQGFDADLVLNSLGLK